MIDPAAHRAMMSALADRYFAEQCRRLGPVDGVPPPLAAKPRTRAHPAPSPQTPERQASRAKKLFDPFRL